MASRSPKRETRKSKGKGGGLAGCRKERVPLTRSACARSRDGAWSISRSSVVPASSPPRPGSLPHLFLPDSLPPAHPPLPALSACALVACRGIHPSLPHPPSTHTHTTPPTHTSLSISHLSHLSAPLSPTPPRPTRSQSPSPLNLPHVASSRNVDCAMATAAHIG